MELIIHTDGGSRGNPGPAAVGVVVYQGENVIHEIALSIGIATNNVAEYTAVLKAFEYLTSLHSPPSAVSFRLDSKLVVEQLNGRFAMKNAGLRPLFTSIQSMRQSLPYSVSFSYVPRAQNAAADALVNQALDATTT